MRKLLILVVFLVLVPPARASGPDTLRVGDIFTAAVVPAVVEVATADGITGGRYVAPASVVGLGGSPGGVVDLLGHNPGVFSRLRLAGVGTPITLTWQGEEYHYVVARRYLVRKSAHKAYQEIRAGAGDALVLVTCWGLRWRLVVVALPFDAVQ